MTANEMKDYFNLLLDGAVFEARTFTDREVGGLLTLSQIDLAKNRIDGLKNRTGRGIADALRRGELAGISGGSATFTRAGHDFMKGTPDNNAYRTPDLDQQPTSTQAYGVWCRVPDEALYVYTETCTLTRGVYTANIVPVNDMDPMLYNALILDAWKNPNYDTVWGMWGGSYTAANTADPNAFDPVAVNPQPSDNSTKYGDTRVETTAVEATLTGFRGVSVEDDSTPVHITTERSRMLIPGKDWNISDYTMHYVKRPKDIVVNTRVPALQQSSEFPSSFHEEIVNNAVRLASLSVIPAEGKFQVADKESAEDE